jgi:hypothetical protein
VLAMSDDRPASVADIVVEELRKKEINGPIRLPKRDFFTRGQKLKVKDPGTFSPATIWNSPACRHVSVMLEWFGRRQTIALPINSVVGCLIATILLMILSENSNPMTGPHRWLTSWLRSCARKRATARFDYQKGISPLVARSLRSRTLAHSLRLRSGIRRHVDT